MDEKDAKKNTSQGKGKGKNKNKTILNLDEFQNSAPTQAGFTAVPAMRWSDVMDGEDEDSNDFGKNKDSMVILPTAPKSIRGPDIDVNQVPTEPPFLCYLSNLPFEASEDDIRKFFRDVNIKRIDLARDAGVSGRARGQGTCEFPDRESLIDAFAFNQDTIKNRPIKLSLRSWDQERESYRRERDGDREDRTAGDWRNAGDSKPSFSSNRPYSDSNNHSSFGNNRNRDYNQRNYGDSSYGDRPSYNNFNRDGGYNRDGNNYNRQSNRMDRNYQHHSNNMDNAYPDDQIQSDSMSSHRNEDRLAIGDREMRRGNSPLWYDSEQENVPPPSDSEVSSNSSTVSGREHHRNPPRREENLNTLPKPNRPQQRQNYYPRLANSEFRQQTTTGVTSTDLKVSNRDESNEASIPAYRSTKADVPASSAQTNEPQARESSLSSADSAHTNPFSN